MKESTRKALNELRSRRHLAGREHYERLKLAKQILADRDWVDDPAGGGGNPDTALKRLEDDFFADICGQYSLCQLLEVLHHFPSFAAWEKHKFNFGKMFSEYLQSLKPAPKPKKSAPAPTNGYPTPAEWERMPTGEQRRFYTLLYRRLQQLEKKLQQEAA